MEESYCDGVINNHTEDQKQSEANKFRLVLPKNLSVSVKSIQNVQASSQASPCNYNLSKVCLTSNNPMSPSISKTLPAFQLKASANSYIARLPLSPLKLNKTITPTPLKPTHISMDSLLKTAPLPKKRKAENFENKSVAIEETDISHQILAEIRMNRKKLIMIYNLLKEEHDESSSMEKPPFQFPVCSLVQLKNLENLLEDDEFEEKLLLHLNNRLKLNKENDAAIRVQKTLEHLFEDQIFDDIGWSTKFNEKHNRKSGATMKVFNAFLRRVTNVKSRDLKGKISKYADLARRRFKRNKDDCTPLLI